MTIIKRCFILIAMTSILTACQRAQTHLHNVDARSSNAIDRGIDKLDDLP